MNKRIEDLAKLAVRRPRITIALVLAAALAGGLLALGLQPSTATDTFISRSSRSYQATAQDYRQFGGDPVVILIREPLTDLVETEDLVKVSQLEACLAGQVLVSDQQLSALTPAPAGSAPPYGGHGSPCAKLMAAKPVQAVYGPGTFLNQAVAGVNTEIVALARSANQAAAQAYAGAYRLALARHLGSAQARADASAARTIATQQALQQLYQLYVQSGISGTPRIDDPQFISQIVFDATRGPNQPKARFAYLFPTADSALIQARLKAGLSAAQQAKAIALIRAAANMPAFRLAGGGTYSVTGAPVVLNDLAAEITGSIARLLIAAVLVMAVVLLLAFRARLRLLPLAVALVAVGITFGVASLLGASLTMASIAVLPILIGLAVDYAIQFQSRTQEARLDCGGAGAVRPRGAASAEVGVARAADAAGPALACAALASAAGFLVLLLSPVPMVRGFGVLLVLGIAIALVCALTAGSAAIVLADRGGGIVGASVRGAADILRDGRALALRAVAPVCGRPRHALAAAGSRTRAAARRTLALVARRPERALAAGVVIAAAGWVAGARTPVQSDITKLVPASMPALRGLNTLERITGVSGEIDVTVRAGDVTKLQTVRWMIDYQQALLAHYGYVDTKGCAQATLCPALSLSDLFSGGQQTGPGGASSLTQSDIDSVLAGVPGYFSQAVLSPDHRDAELAFGIRLMPLSEQQQVIDYMASHLHPPAGVTARLAGLPVLAAEANAALTSPTRRLLTLLAGLIAVALVLLAVFRRAQRALVPLAPIALATGWSALILFAIRIPLNPMSATLGALVIAISTEFSVLLSERFRQERVRGAEAGEALTRTYRSTGAAVIASGVTAIAGFGVLAFSNITMLRDFGLVTLVDLTASLAGVLLVLPAVLVLSQRGELARTVRAAMRRANARLRRPRRRLRGQRVA